MQGLLTKTRILPAEIHEASRSNDVFKLWWAFLLILLFIIVTITYLKYSVCLSFTKLEGATSMFSRFRYLTLWGGSNYCDYAISMEKNVHLWHSLIMNPTSDIILFRDSFCSVGSAVKLKLRLQTSFNFKIKFSSESSLWKKFTFLLLKLPRSPEFIQSLNRNLL